MEKSELLIRISEDAEAVAELTRDELAGLKTELREYGAALMAGLEDSDDKKADLEAAAEAKERLEAVKERLAEFEAEDAQLAEEAAEIAVAFEAEEEPEAEVVETEEVEEGIKVEESTENVIDDNEVIETEEKELELVASAPSIGAIAKRAPKPPPAEAVVVAPASLSMQVSYPHGFASPKDLGAATKKVMREHSNDSKFKASISQFDTSKQHKYEVIDNEQHDSAVLDELLKDLQVRTPEALTAAASFCAPAQPIYDYFGIAQRAGMIQLPTLNASRGRITYRTSPSYASVLANATWSAAAGQTYTAANAESGASKDSFDAECPATVTCSVDAFPVDIRFTTFTDRFDPETVANVMENTMIFHDHYVNSQHIATMVTASTAAGGGDTGGGGLVNVANLVGFEAMKYRDTFRMSPDATLELVVPAWVIDALVADLVARESTMSFENARARVSAIFASLGLRIQAVQDWQSPGDAGDGGWRQATDMLLFAPGTFVRLDGGTLDLGIVRDSTLNSTNEFSVFVETFEAVCEIGHDSWLLDDVTICPRGAAAAGVTLDCNPGFGS